jgi:hypothetical protein
VMVKQLPLLVLVQELQSHHPVAPQTALV